MRAKTVIRNFTGYFLLAAMVWSVPAPAGANVKITTYGQPGWTLGAVTDINKAGMAVGIYDDTGGIRHGFSYKNGVYTEIGPPGWTDTWVWAVDESGRAAGYGDDVGGRKGFLYSGGTYMTLLPAGWTSSQAVDMSDMGHVIGEGNDGGGTKGFLYTIGTGAYTTLDVPGSTQTNAFGVNNSGQVVGSTNVGGVAEAFSWKAGTFTSPAPPGWSPTLARSVNDAGVILGMGEAAGIQKCFLNDGGTFTALLPPGYETARCTDINKSGMVLGSAAPSGGGSSEYFIYDDGSYYILDLSAPGAELISLNDQNIFAGARLSLSGFEAITGFLFPAAAITANDEKNTVGIAPSSPLVLRITMEAVTFAGKVCDWWIVAQTPTGPYSFDVASRRWLPGLRPATVGPLRDVTGLKLPPVSKAPGLYTYYFGADGFPNGRIDFAAFVYDTVTVHIR